ncbi:DUF4440 domain-containing protein [Sphingomonas astaxanthinifaciens]|uniref:DUF4440 domain-containing protein n=1 Tax=Sphingomonas astaxanthinifaciens DSM 22298 TaxID=1123267 RepID=A0ABQ5Z0N6_9SPHN|nr:DUF4440 domain-containing protein [Sphingomonas astaxanthinifaciens]GLR46318.1 hypothetical protein GCM10007925_00290 [Sphingomonas astaxanthinifaciens DSM 22298]
MASDGNARLEALETQLMRAWVNEERKALRNLLSRRFRMVVGASAPVLLDRKSLLEAAGDRWRIERFRFGQSIYAREIDKIGIFAAEIELEGVIDGRDARGRWWQADIWKRGGLGRGWRLVDRQLARVEDDRAFPEAVRALQLWR